MLPTKYPERWVFRSLGGSAGTCSFKANYKGPSVLALLLIYYPLNKRYMYCSGGFVEVDNRKMNTSFLIKSAWKDVYLMCA